MRNSLVMFSITLLTFASLGFGAVKIQTNTTVEVPSAQYPTLQSAVDFASKADISNSAILQIKMLAGTYQLDDHVVLNIPNGDRVVIRGDVDNPATVRLKFNSTHGIRVIRGSKIRNIDGLVIVGSGKGDGIAVVDNASAYVGPNVIVRNFNFGVKAGLGGSLIFRGTSRSNVTSGVQSFWGGTVNARNSKAIENGLHGYVVSGNASLDAQSAVSKGNGTFGFISIRNGFLQATSSRSENNKRAYVATFGGQVVANKATVLGNEGPAFSPEPNKVGPTNGVIHYQP